MKPDLKGRDTPTYIWIENFKSYKEIQAEVRHKKAELCLYNIVLETTRLLRKVK